MRPRRLHGELREGGAGGGAVGLPGPVPPVVDIVADWTSCGWDTQVHGGEATVRSVQHHLDASGARLRARPAAVRIAGGTRRRTRRFSRRLASVLAAPYRPPSPPFGPFRPHWLPRGPRARLLTPKRSLGWASHEPRKGGRTARLKRLRDANLPTLSLQVWLEVGQVELHFFLQPAGGAAWPLCCRGGATARHPGRLGRTLPA